MQFKDIRAGSLCAAVGAILLVAANIGGQSKKKPPAQKTAPAPIATPTPSEGTTAVAARGRPVSTAAGRAVTGARKTALASANVRHAVRVEVVSLGAPAPGRPPTLAVIF